MRHLRRRAAAALPDFKTSEAVPLRTSGHDGSRALTPVGVRAAPVVAAAAVAAATFLASATAPVAALGAAAATAMLVAVLGRRVTILPSGAVLLLAVQFLVASSGTGFGARLGGTAGEVAGLWAVQSLFALAEQTPLRARVRPRLLSVWATRYLTVVAVSAPIAVVIVAVGRFAPRAAWIRELGPLAALALLGSLAVAVRRRPPTR